MGRNLSLRMVIAAVVAWVPSVIAVAPALADPAQANGEFTGSGTNFPPTDHQDPWWTTFSGTFYGEVTVGTVATLGGTCAVNLLEDYASLSSGWGWGYVHCWLAGVEVSTNRYGLSYYRYGAVTYLFGGGYICATGSPTCGAGMLTAEFTVVPTGPLLYGTWWSYAVSGHLSLAATQTVDRP